jgi:glyoxylase-like metal-dependent hydrolase (beta-lactamase superfamily II)
MPDKPVAFRVESLGGRGTQEMIHGPRHHGGDAVVYIRDPKHGEDTYTFDVMWGAATSQQ